jgi:hypothetical protein
VGYVFSPSGGRADLTTNFRLKTLVPDCGLMERPPVFAKKQRRYDTFKPLEQWIRMSLTEK